MRDTPNHERERVREAIARAAAEFEKKGGKPQKKDRVMAQKTTTQNTFIKLTEVKRRTTLSTTEIYRRIEAGEFPKQIKLGAKAVAWLEHEIQAWIDERIAESREAAK